jgi:hypothetical protein
VIESSIPANNSSADISTITLFERRWRWRCFCRRFSARQFLPLPGQVTMHSRMSCAISVCLLSLFATPASAEDAVELAARLIGRPYVWGAEGPGSFDCSGLTHYVYGRSGIALPRRAIDQSRVGETVRRLQRGDLLFFASDQRRSLVTHVGIYEGGGMMIDASQRHGRVRRDDLDEQFWSERFMFARRITDIGTRRVRVPTERPSSRGSDRAKVAARVLGQIAEVLLRRR